MDRVRTTLFMLMSIDGKISTGDKDSLDFDKDLPNINGIREGLYQYYEFERKTDINSFNSGRVMAKIGMNESQKDIKKLPVNFVIVDSNHLTKVGIENLIRKSKKLFLITSNENHAAFNFKEVETIFYKKCINFINLFKKLKQTYKMNRLTIQSGGTLNSILLRNNLIDNISLVVAPTLIGGINTSTLIGGESLHSIKDLKYIKTAKLEKCKVLKNSYLHLKYKIKKK